jgi:hypothetical protein
MPNDDYHQNSGCFTSFACPHVSGVAALILAVNPNLSVQKVRYIIESTCTKLPNYVFDPPNVAHPNGTWHEEVGYGLVNAHAAVLAARCYSDLPIVHGTITQNTTWNTDKHAIGAITVPNGMTLNITSEVKFDHESSISIHPGARLILDGGTLTSACQGEMWQGIFVQGDPNQPVGNQYQGYVQLKKGGTIENAVCGITVQGGGYVSAQNAQFVNNTTGIKLEPLALGQIGSSASFEQTDFILDNNYLENQEDFVAHILAESSGDVSVSGCNFSSTAPKNSSATDRNNGILAFNTNLTVKAHCLGGVSMYAGCLEPMLKTSFFGFTNAIRASNSGASPILKVWQSSFDNNIKGILIEGINYHQIIKNDFVVPQLGPDEFTQGARIINATGYRIEENTFFGTYSFTPLEHFDSKTIGLSVRNSGPNENEVYKNSFANFAVGQSFYENNASSVLPYTGLQTLCNTFNYNQNFDIVVGSYPGIWPPPHANNIRRLQGSMQKPAGNLFNGVPFIRNIDNHQATDTITYYYGNQPAEFPPDTKKVYTVNTSSTNGCPSKLGPKLRELSLAQYDEWNEQYEYWLARFFEVCGDEVEGGRQKAEGRKQKAESRKQKVGMKNVRVF